MPQSLQQLFDTAIRHHDAGQFQQAHALYQQILAQDPTQIPVLQRLAQLAHQTNNNPAAEKILRQIIQNDPTTADNYLNLAVILAALHRPHDAVAACRTALQLRPDNPLAFSNLAFLLHVIGSPREGIAACQRALSLQPNLADAYNNLGINLVDIGQPVEAVAAYQKAIALAPNFAKAYNNLAGALQIMGRCEESAAACEKAIALDPHDGTAYTNLGNTLQDLALHDQALDAHRKALALKPNDPYFQSNYLFSLSYHPATTARVLFEETRRWAQTAADPLKPFIKPHNIDRSPGRPLNIGYVSADLRLHSVAYFLLPLLEAHDKNNFHITCYPTHPKSDETTARIQAASNQWRPLAALSDEQAAEQIRRDQIDILVDLSGHTAHNRLLLFARQPAPIQISWLGYPATTGLDTIHYRLTDALADPPDLENDSLHTEKLLRLPTAWCFFPLSGSPPVAPSPHLANGYITFGSLSSFAKCNDDTLRLSAQLLAKVPRSRLLIKTSSGPKTTARLHKIFAAENVSPERLLLLPKLPDLASHLQRYHQIDIALDTFPYHGTTTTCEALWMGVPVITRTGDRHASRVGTSLLTTLNLPELITTTPEQFLDAAKNLAANSPLLQSLRTSLRPRMQQSPLMNAKQFAQQIESTYREIWQSHHPRP